MVAFMHKYTYTSHTPHNNKKKNLNKWTDVLLIFKLKPELNDAITGQLYDRGRLERIYR